MASYTLTDSHTKVLDNLRHNLQRNLEHWRSSQQQSDRETLHLENDSDQTTATVTPLDWETFSQADEVEADLVLGADIVFDPEVLPSLVRTVRTLLTRREDCRALLACCVRNQKTFSLFLSLLTESNLSFTKEEMRELKCDIPVYLVTISTL